jgi:L-aspartate semialdehyde sulfurtransferase ferredoxin
MLCQLRSGKNKYPHCSPIDQEVIMADQTIRLIYPPTMANVPVIYQLIRSFDIVVNIVGAQISSEQGWIDINIGGEDQDIQGAIAWLTQQGIEAFPVNN